MPYEGQGGQSRLFGSPRSVARCGVRPISPFDLVDLKRDAPPELIVLAVLDELAVTGLPGEVDGDVAGPVSVAGDQLLSRISSARQLGNAFSTTDPSRSPSAATGRRRPLFDCNPNFLSRGPNEILGRALSSSSNGADRCFNTSSSERPLSLASRLHQHW